MLVILDKKVFVAAGDRERLCGHTCQELLCDATTINAGLWSVELVDEGDLDGLFKAIAQRVEMHGRVTEDVSTSNASGMPREVVL